jgi:hypothetical protein
VLISCEAFRFFLRLFRPARARQAAAAYIAVTVVKVA